MFTDFEVKDVWYPFEGDRHTTLRFIDGRSYSVPLMLSDREIADIERNAPDDQTMRIIGYRLPDFMPWIETTGPIYANYAALYV